MLAKSQQAGFKESQAEKLKAYKASRAAKTSPKFGADITQALNDNPDTFNQSVAQAPSTQPATNVSTAPIYSGETPSGYAFSGYDENNNPQFTESASTSISEAVKKVGETYADKANRLEKGSYLEYADSYENIMGKPAPFKTREEYLAWRKNQSQEDLDYLDKQQGYAREIEKIQFNKAKEGARSQQAGVTEAMAQSREGAIGSSRHKFSGEFAAQIDQNMKQLDIQQAAAEEQRTKAMVDLKRAQESGDMQLAEAIQGKIDSIENELKDTDMRRLQVATQKQQMDLETAKFQNQVSNEQQANYRANLSAFNGMVETGAPMNTEQLASYAKSLNIPLEEVIGYYEGAQDIRNSREMSVEEKQVALADHKRQFDLVSQGYVTKQAQQIKGVMDLVKNNKITQAEASDLLMGLGIDSSLNPMTQIKQRMNTASTLIKEYEAKYQGQPPPEGSVERLKYDKAKLDLQISNLEYNDTVASYANEIPTSEAKNAMALPGKSRVTPSFGEGHKECGEAYNDYTNEGGAGNSYQSKMDLVVSKDNPQVGNGLVIPLATGGGLVTNNQTQPGHIETVISVNPILNSIQTVSYNRDLKGGQTIQSYNIDDLKKKYGDNWGFTGSTLKDEWSSKLKEFSPDVQYGDLDEGIVNALASYDLDPKDLSSRLPKGTTQSQREKYLAAAIKLNPEYSSGKFNSKRKFITDWENTTTPTSTGYVNYSANTAIKHLLVAYRTFDAMGNAGFTDANAVQNYLKMHAGDPDIASYRSIIEPMAGEIGKVIAGGKPDAEMERGLRESFSSNLSPVQMKAVIKTNMDLMASRIQTGINRYKKNLGFYPEGTLDPEAIEALQEMGINPADFDSSFEDTNVDSYGEYAATQTSEDHGDYTTSTENFF